MANNAAEIGKNVRHVLATYQFLTSRRATSSQAGHRESRPDNAENFKILQNFPLAIIGERGFLLVTR